MNSLRSLVRPAFDRIRLRPGIRTRLSCWVHGPEFRQWCQAHDCPTLPTRFELYQYLLENEGLKGPIDYLEFGVASGGSIKWWVEHNTDAASRFVGFDTFEGLPEDWGTWWGKGSFSTGGKSPDITDSRCSFVKGLFQSTLPGWLSDQVFSNRIIVHLDADLYSSTLVVLTQLLPRLKSGDVLIFDEFRDFLHEYRAFIDATTAYGREFEPIGHTPSWIQAGFRAR